MRDVINSPFVVDFCNAKAYAQAVELACDPGGDNLSPGEIYLANDSRLNEGTFDQPLTDFAVGGWDRMDVAEELNALFPEVPRPRRFTYKAWLNGEQGISDVDEDLVAVNGDPKIIEWKNTEVHGVTQNRSLMTIVNVDEEPVGWERTKIMLLMQRIRRNSLRRAYALLAASAVNTNRTWDTTAGKDPDQDMRTVLSTAADITLIRPNLVVYGETAWTKRTLAHRAQTAAGGFASSPLTPEELASQLMVDQVRVSKNRYTASSSSRSQIVGNKVYSFFSEGPSLEDPSNIKRFTSPTRTGPGVRVFTYPIGDKRKAIGVEHYELLAITSTLGIRQETIS